MPCIKHFSAKQIRLYLTHTNHACYRLLRMRSFVHTLHCTLRLLLSCVSPSRFAFTLCEPHANMVWLFLLQTQPNKLRCFCGGLFQGFLGFEVLPFPLHRNLKQHLALLHSTRSVWIFASRCLAEWRVGGTCSLRSRSFCFMAKAIARGKALLQSPVSFQPCRPSYSVVQICILSAVSGFCGAFILFAAWILTLWF